jgi:chromosome segregation ATPase
MTKQQKDHHHRVVSIAAQAAGQYPILDVRDAIHSTSAERDAVEPAKAAVGLAHLDDEINALQAKWQTVAAEFGAREARIAYLQAEVAARDAANARLITELQRDASALLAADERLTAKDREIAALIDDRKQRDERIAALSTKLADAETAHNKVLEQITRAEAETARLNDAVRDEQAAASAVVKVNQELLSEQTRLRSEIQDLETYVNGRHERWSALNAELAGHKDAMRGLERALEERDAVAAQHDEEKTKLGARILELERQGEALTGRLAERERAGDELRKELTAHAEQIERLETGRAALIKEAEEALTKAASAEARIHSLETSLKQRNESIDALNAEIERGAAALSELIAARDDYAKRIRGLEKALAERSQPVTLLGNDRRLARQELSARIAQLALSQEAAKIEAQPVDLEQRRVDADADSSTNASNFAATPVARKLTATIAGQDVTYPIVGDVMTIGRDEGSDIRIVSHFVSRLHAKIRTHDGKTIIEDAGSRNGVLVNSQKIHSSRVLRHGDVVSIAGELNFRFVEGAAS